MHDNYLITSPLHNVKPKSLIYKRKVWITNQTSNTCLHAIT